MKTYPIPMVPGPVSVPADVLDAYRVNLGAGGLENNFFDLYEQTAQNLQKILGTQNDVVIQTGEGMLALWSALKSCLAPGDRVLSIATGVFGYGIAEMAKAIGAEVHLAGYGYDQTIGGLSDVEAAIEDFKPKMITVVHCETPSGTLNPLAALGNLKAKHGVPLLYADVVASAGGALVLADEWNIDLAVCGSQKCLSAPPCMAFLSVSDAAWDIINKIDYQGYDALKPFQKMIDKKKMPYTPYWHGLSAVYTASQNLLMEGLNHSYLRHQTVAEQCREGITSMGLSLFPEPDAVLSPTVTAVRLPENVAWVDLDCRLREKGLVVGGSHGPLSGKVFRLGHMGSQADASLMEQALAVLKEVVDYLLASAEGGYF